MNRSKSFKIASILLLLLLVIQYVLGMIVALFNEFDFSAIDTEQGSFFARTGPAFRWASEQGPWALRLHWVTAILLILVGLYILVLAIKNRQTRVWRMMIAFNVLLLVAANSGAAFLAYNGNNYASLIMSLAFLACFGIATRIAVDAQRGS